jgi:hypothetical protein
MDSRARSWLLLITNLPGHNPALRMRFWRALKAAGAGLMRDGAYVLPTSDRARSLFEAQSREVQEAGGQGHVVSFESNSAAQDDSLIALFDRTKEYAELLERLAKWKKQLARLTELQSRQELNGIARESALVGEIDFFAGEPREQMQRALSDAEQAFNEKFAPDEPHAAQKAIVVRDRKEYGGRTWATRKRLWIDRVASAWLIRKFIDPKGRFVWLDHSKDCPKRAVGFDFDGAEFTHVGSKVTFEVLVASFDLEGDSGLVRLGELVHHLDVGGIPVAEGPGLTTIMAGARSLQDNDDDLLKAMCPVIDALYAGYVTAIKRSEG